MKVERNNLNRKVFALKDFRGVDYASSPLEVNPYRATDMANLLLRDGMLKKRKGFKQICLLDYPTLKGGETLDKTFDIKVLAISGRNVLVQYLYKDKTKGSEFKVYTTSSDGNTWSVKETITLNNAKSLGSAVYVNGEWYIACGGAYVKFSGDGVSEVTELDVYVPTTTINIPVVTPIYSGENITSYNVDANVLSPYTSNESINLLTRIYKEGLAGYTHEGNSAWRYYRLNHKIHLWDTPTIKMTVKVNATGEEILFNDFVRQTISSDKPPAHFTTAGMHLIYGYNDKYWVSGITRFVSPSTGVEIGSAMFYRVDHKDSYDEYNAIVYIPTNFNGKFRGFPLENGSYVDISEVTVYIEFEDVGLTDSSTLIKSCTCATLFGVDGANDRIFVGGGNNGNIVYFSENDISLKPNPTYFPADQFLVCGMDGAKVNGFMRVSNGTLAIFKDVENYDDVSVYYTSGYYTDVGTGEEGNTYKQARFTVQAGDITRNGISASGIDNFEGDNLFVSKEGVFGIQLSNNVASGERYARERSRTINPKITKFGLRNAKSIVYDEKYFLAVDNGEVYVADSRYKFTLKGDQENTFNYEWFRLTGIFVKEWFILNDTLWFIDKDGYLCEFTESFADQYMVTTDNNELTVNTETVTFNEERLELVKASSYAIDQEGRTWQLQLTEDEKSIVIPEDIEIAENADLTLWFQVPIPAYWQSAVLDLENTMYRKNMWALSMTAAAEHGGMINLGYKTRLNAVHNIEIEGVNKGGYEDISFLGGLQTFLISGKESAFGMYTFDVGGYVGINSYRRRIFERDFVHIQLLFTSETVNDCVVSELDIEYAVSKKNIGVG